MNFDLPTIQKVNQPLVAIIQKVEEKPKEVEIVPIKVTVQPGDKLEAIAKAHNTTVQRLFDKNPHITHPDVINVGDELIVPSDTEILSKRELPTIIQPTVVTGQTSAPSGRSSVSGNTYTPGYCTHYAKQRRPDMPNSLGNANTWGIRAEQQGFTVNNTPSVGAVAVAITYMHVAIVEAIEGNRVLVSEQNYGGFGIVSQRWTTISEFEYIH